MIQSSFLFCSDLIDFIAFLFITIFICHVQPLVAHGLKIYLFILFAAVNTKLCL